MAFPLKKTLLGVGLALGALTALCSIEDVASGEYVRIQDPSGSFQWYTDPGIKFKVPFFSTTTTYQEITTVTFSDNEETRDAASIAEAPAMIKFADGYTGQGNFTFRFRLSPDDEKLEMMHKAVKRQSSLQGNTLLPAADELLNQTANQFTGSGYAQGGKGQFKMRLIDQAKNGMLSVKRTRKEISSHVADDAVDGNRKQNATTKVYEYVMEVQNDSKGNPYRTPLDISQYGIKIAQVTMGNFHESKELGTFLADRRSKERASKNRIDEQRVERENAITEALKGETARVKAQNTANMTKDAAVIAAQQRVELAEKQAEQETVEREKVAALAIIDKNRQLQEAQANEGIQKANATAAKHQADALKAVGFAEAAVAKAKLEAKQSNKDIYLAELNRDIAIQQAISMERTKLDAPNTVIISGDKKSGNVTSDLLNVKLVNDVVQK